MSFSLVIRQLTPLTPLFTSFLFFSTGGHGPGQTYAGLTLHEPPFIYKALGQLAGATMWFWVFYRFYHDGDAFINGHDSHWMHDLIEEEKKKLKA